MDSVPITSPASVLTVDDSGSSFEQKELKAVIVVAVVGIVLFILMGTGVLHQPWTLSAGASQPRFIHIQGMPPDHMFDNRTAQTCTTDPIVYDSIERIEDDMRKFAVARGEEPHKLNFYYGYGYEGTKNAPLEKDDWQHLPSVGDPFIDRCNALKKNPLNPPVYHYDGMPYCKEL